jgi:hypothetical protein
MKFKRVFSLVLLASFGYIAFCAAPEFSTAVINTENSIITVTCNQGVEDETANALDNTDLSLTINAGVATISSFTVTHTSGDASFTIELTLTGTPDGNEVITIQPVDGSKIRTAGTNDYMSDTESIDVTMNDQTAPDGYSVTIDQSPVNASNETSASFTFAGAEPEATYDYTISSSGGGTNVTGSGTITTPTDRISGIDVSGLNDGILTLSVTLTDTADNAGPAVTDTETYDATAPDGYSVTIDQSPVNASNETSVSFTFAGAEPEATYDYTISSSGGGTNVTGSGTITTPADRISGIDVSGLNDGILTLSVTLTDTADNAGPAVTDTETYDATAPDGYSVTIDQSPVNASNETSVSFTFAGAEPGTTYDYTISSSGGGTNVTGSGTITTPTDRISGIDVSGLNDGILTLSVTLTNTAGNEGPAATDAETYDATAPDGYSVTIDQSPVNASNETSVSFTFTGAEPGATYNYTISSSGGGTNVTGSGTINTSTDRIFGIDVSGLNDGILTLSVILTDIAYNTGIAATDTRTKDVITDVPILSLPASDGADDVNLSISFELPEAALSGSVKLIFTRTGGNNDNNDPHEITFNSNFETADTHTTDLNGSDLSANANVASVDSRNGNDFLLDGAEYTVRLIYQDALGNDAVYAENTQFLYDASPLTADIIDVSPDPRNSNAGTVIVKFSKGVKVSTVDKTDFILTRSGGAVDLSSVTVGADLPVYSRGGIDYDTVFLVDLSGVTVLEGNYTLTLDASESGIETRNLSSFTEDASDSWVMDLAPPELNSVSIASNNTNPDYVGVGGVVSLTITGSEKLDMSSASVSIAGQPAIISGSDKNWTASYTMQSGDPTDPSGFLEFSIEGFNDLAGNTGTTVTGTTNGSSVKFDESVPSLISVSIASDNANNASFAKPGDVVIISFTSDEEIENVIARIGIEAKSMTVSSSSATSWVAEYSLPSSGLTEGDLPISISFKDYAGNQVTHGSGTTDGSSVTFDKTAPSAPDDIELVSDYGLSDTDNITHEINPEFFGTAESFATVKLYSNVNGLIGTVTASDTSTFQVVSSALDEGSHIITATAIDGPGNVSPISSSLTITIDNTAPGKPGKPDMAAGSDTGILDDDNITSDNTPTLAGTSETNCRIYVYSGATLLDSTDADIFGVWSLTTPLLAEGNHSIKVNSADAAGNIGPDSDILLVTIDTSAPDTPGVPDLRDESDNGVSNSDDITNDATPTFTGMAEGETAIQLYSDLEGLIGTGTADGTGSWVITSGPLSSGIHAITVVATDVAGNVSPISPVLNVTIDTEMAAFSHVSIYSNNHNPVYAVDGDRVSLEFTTSEAVETPDILINGLAPDALAGGPVSWLATRTMAAEEDEGTIPFTISIRDLAGNAPAAMHSTTDGTAVVFDDSNPGISSVTVNSGVYKVGDVISLLIQSDDITYTGTTVEVNGKPQVLVNNMNNNYTIDYLVEEGDAELDEAGSVPVNIVLQDPAGLTASLAEATSIGGTITIDPHTPQIGTFSSNAEGTGNLIIGDNIIFTLTPVTAEVGLNIQPLSYNGTLLNWVTTDGAVYTAIYEVKEGDPEQTSPLQPSKVMLSDNAGNADSMVYSGIGKEIYTTYPTARITGSASKCDYGQTVPIIFQFTGRKPFTFSYSNGSQTFGPIDHDGFTYSINAVEGEFTMVQLTDSTGNYVTDALENATIDVIELPVVTTNFFNSPYNIESPADELSQYVVQEDKRNGIFSAAEGIGYSNGSYYFYPGNIPAALLDQDIQIVYTYTDGITGCFTKDTNTVFVSSTPVRIVGLQPVYCQDNDPVTITGNLPVQHTGRFDIFDADSNLVTSGWAQTNSVTLTFDPKQFPAGDYRMKYTAIKLPEYTETNFSSTRDFSIEAIRTGIEITGLSDTYCFDSLSSSLPIRLNFTPGPGDIGNFFGSDVFTVIPGEHTARFELRNARANSIYTLNYIYESVNGCISDMVSRTVQVNPLPELAFELDNNYNYAQNSIPLSGTPDDPKYNFSGEGVSNNTLFTSAARINSPILITFSGRNDNGCYNEVVDTTIIYQANETIEGITAEGVYCYEDLVLDISCTPNISDTITGTFRSMRNALEPVGKNRAKYYFNRIGSGADTVYFDYDVLGTGYSVKKAIFIDSIGEVSITSSTADFDYCHSEALVQFVGNQSYTLGGQGEFEYVGSSGETEITRSSTTAISPKNEAPGTYSIGYSYTSSRGCSAETSHVINIYPEPVTDFSQLISCPDLTTPVPFTNLTTFSGDESELSWEWRFEGGLPVMEKNPVYTFQSNGLKQVTLTATTNNGCAVSKSRQYIIGNFARADFEWDNECNTGEQVTMTSTSLGGVPEIGEYTWRVEGAVIPGDRSAVHDFSDIGEYDIRLVYTSSDGCIDSVTKTLVIQPYIRITEDFEDQTYFEDFESGNELFTWQTRGLTDKDTTRWNLGFPDGDVISIPASGNHSWFTRITERTDIENSEVVSPCFDLSGLEKPMIKLNIWSSSEFKRDGAVMQYSQDFGNTWNNLGDVNEGVNWFNSEDIQSQPGGLTQFEGWNGVRMEDWMSARYSLDFLKGATNVRFRMAYAADGGGVEDVDGFAFDDVWIGERQQNVLTEYFTNTTISGSVEGNTNMLAYEASRVADMVPIHYHTGYPSGDLLFSDYEEGPSARVFYYGVSNVPKIISNGFIRSGLDSKAVDLFEKEVDMETLRDPMVSVDLSLTLSSAEVTITALDDGLTGESMVLFIAVVKDSVESDGVYYHNVLRRFLPDPAGIILSAGGLTKGETITESVPLNLGGSSMLIGSKLVVFVQNINSKRVYQSVWYDLSGLTSLAPDNINNLVDVYPNPATDRLFIDSEFEIRRLVITDIAGRVVRVMEPDQVRVDIPVAEFKYGIYMIRGITDHGEFNKKFIKQ